MHVSPFAQKRRKGVWSGFCCFPLSNYNLGVSYEYVFEASFVCFQTQQCACFLWNGKAKFGICVFHDFGGVFLMHMLYPFLQLVL
jgi:hypothetical protein